MVPRARLCLLSPRCERRSLPQERNIPRPNSRPAAAGNPPGFCGFASRRCDSQPCPVASGGPLSLPPKKEAKETAKGNLFRGGSLWTPSPTTKGAPPPLDSPLLDEGRGFGRELRIVTAGVHTGFAMTVRGVMALKLSVLPPSQRDVASPRGDDGL